jgi:hypothetical protein
LEGVTFQSNKRKPQAKWPILGDVRSNTTIASTKPPTWDKDTLNDLQAQNRRNLIGFYLEDFIKFAMGRGDFPGTISLRNRFREFELIHKKQFELTPEFETIVREELRRRGEVVPDVLPYHLGKLQTIDHKLHDIGADLQVLRMFMCRHSL